MKALLLYPEMPPTFWTMYQVMEIIGKKASYPPLGLLTIAALRRKCGKSAWSISTCNPSENRTSGGRLWCSSGR